MLTDKMAPTSGQYVGIREVADNIWLVSFMDNDPGFSDEAENRLEPVGQNPLAVLVQKVLPM
jgi:putative transposase